ncbi:MAG: hypothetical protein CMJ81_19250 [Planctomycetaceae bacterium]|nr:hypothetical protein [Planctomycetaceae bacterium]MBP60083.1 hypothetical protein [Planctomycetaceae bacterium]
MMTLQQHFDSQQLSNDYTLVDGVKMNAERGNRFKISNPWFRSHVDNGHFVELRIDSLRFSAHPDAPVNCTCPHCNEPAEKPILCHDEPASLLPIAKQSVPSRGWGEQFWVRIRERQGVWLAGDIDNLLYESRLHDLNRGDTLYFHQDHILIVHGTHHQEILSRLNNQELEALGEWLQENHHL